MRTYIKVKRGILDPKHVETIGPAIWLYLYIVDRADWKTGILRGYTDADAAESLGRPRATIRFWRRKLIEAEYLEAAQKQYTLDLAVANWNDPRDNWSEGDNQGDNLLSPSSEGDNQGDNGLPLSESEGDNQVSSGVVTLHLTDSRLNLNTTLNLSDGEIERLFREITGNLTFPGSTRESDLDRLRAIAAAHNGTAVDYCRPFFDEWKSRHYSRSNTGWLDWAVANDIPKQRKGQKTNDRSTGKKARQETYTEADQDAAEKIARRLSRQ